MIEVPNSDEAASVTLLAVSFNYLKNFEGRVVVGGATSAGFTSILGGSGSGRGSLVFIIVDGVISAGLIMGFGIGVSGSLGIILSLALKYDGRSPLPVGGSTMLGILVLL